MFAGGACGPSDCAGDAAGGGCAEEGLRPGRGAGAEGGDGVQGKKEKEHSHVTSAQFPLVLCAFLKIRNRLIMPCSKMRNCESKIDSILILMTILLVLDSRIDSKKKIQNNPWPL